MTLGACVHVRACMGTCVCTWVRVRVCHMCVMQEVKTRCISIAYFNLSVEDSFRADLEAENGPIERNWVFSVLPAVLVTQFL